MKKTLNILFASVALLFLAACGMTSRLPTHKNVTHHSADSLFPAMTVTRYNKVQNKLEKAYSNWRGTPYEWGGETSSGVDCSAFMKIVFRKYFSVELPRVTKSQIYAGHKVDRSKLKPGDLVFFKTGRKTLHVGVIIDQPRFMHASTSQGVTISSLENNYWSSRYLTAKRVLD